MCVIETGIKHLTVDRVREPGEKGIKIVIHGEICVRRYIEKRLIATRVGMARLTALLYDAEIELEAG